MIGGTLQPTLEIAVINSSNSKRIVEHIFKQSSTLAQRQTTSQEEKNEGAGRVPERWHSSTDTRDSR